MGCPSEVEIGDNLVFSVCTHDPDTGVLTDADAVPAYRVYEDETGAAILNGNMAKLDDANTTGFYSELIACTAGNGFENGKTYSIYIAATVDGDQGGISFGFKAYDARKSDLRQMGGVAQSATDLKDFADAGYDPATDKVQGVVLVDTVTTLTGHTAQTGDSFARIGAPAGASISADIAAIEAQTDDIGVAGAGLTAINLPDQIMNITGNITGNLTGSVGSVTGAVGSVVGHTPQTGDSFVRLGAPVGADIAADLAAIDNFVDDLEGRLTAARAGFLDNLNGHIPQTGDSFVRIGAPVGADIAADLAAIDNFVDELETRLTAVRAGYLDELAAANIPADVDTLLARLSAVRGGYLDELAAANIPTDLTNIETDTQNIQGRIPAALVGGRMSADSEAISGSTGAADRLEASAETIVTGAAVAGTLSTTQMTTDLAEATNDHYNGRVVIWTSGVLKDQATDITDYDGATKMLTYTAITEAPGIGDTFVIV